MIQQSHSQTYIWRKRYMHPYVQSSTVYNSQDMEATEVSISRWMDEEDVKDQRANILRLWRPHNLFHKQLFSSAIIVKKQPQMIHKPSEKAMFQQDFIFKTGRGTDLAYEL